MDFLFFSFIFNISFYLSMLISFLLFVFHHDRLNFDRHQNRVRRYTHGLRRLIRLKSVGDAIEDNLGDTIDRYLWKCVYTVNGKHLYSLQLLL